MKTHNFVTSSIEQQPSIGVKALGVLLIPLVIVGNLCAYVDKVMRRLVASWIFETDIHSADVLLYKYYRQQVWLDDEPAGLIEMRDEEDQEPPSAEMTMPVLPFEEVQPVAPVSKPSKNADLELALDSLIDYTLAAFEEDLINEEGVLLKGNIAPWAQRGDLPNTTKERAKMIIDKTEPPVWFKNGSRLWQFNLKDYVNSDSAKAAIIDAYNSLI